MRRYISGREVPDYVRLFASVGFLFRRVKPGVAWLGGVSLDAGGGSVITQQRVTSDRDKIGRNDPCWCGSGKKYKRCHGA